MKKYCYQMTEGKSIKEFAERVYDYCNNRNMETQMLTPIDSEAVIIQAQSNHSNAKALVGQDLATTVVLKMEDNEVSVEVGKSRWLDKSILLTISMIIFWWLAIPAGIGMYRQNSMNNEIKALADNYFLTEAVA